MLLKVMIVSLLLGVFTLTGPLTFISVANDQAETTTFYESCIVRKIVSCDAKTILLITSKSKNLQNYMEKKAHMAEFLNDEKGKLIEEMAAMKLEPKQYKIDFFLNSRFYDSIQYQKYATLLDLSKSH